MLHKIMLPINLLFFFALSVTRLIEGESLKSPLCIVAGLGNFVKITWELVTRAGGWTGNTKKTIVLSNIW